MGASSDLVRAKARELLSRCPDTAPDELHKLVAEWNHDDETALLMRDELLRLGCTRAIAAARLEVAREHARPRGAAKKRVHILQVPASSAYGWALPNGAQLGTANIADLDDAIARHRVKAAAHIGWVKFYAALKAKLVKARLNSVGELFSEPELLQLSDASGVVPATAVTTNPFAE